MCAEPDRDGDGDGADGRRHGLLLAALLLGYVAVAACSLHAPIFPLDDTGELHFVRRAASWMTLLGEDFYHFFRPVKNLLFAAYDALAARGGMPAARALVVLVGAASALAVHGLCCRLMRSRGWGLAATAVWLLAPTMVSCTAWLSSSNILAMTGFAALALTCHLRAGDRTEAGDAASGGRWAALAGLVFFLALACYEGAVGAAALFFAVDFYLYPERLRRRDTWRRYLLYALVLALYLAVRAALRPAIAVAGSFSGVSPLFAMLSAGYFTTVHAGIWCWPFGQQAVIGSYFRGQVPPVVLAACWGLVLAAAGLALVWRRRFPLAALGVAWFLVAFAPMSNVFGFRNGPYGDYYLALASVGAALAVAAVLRGLRPAERTGVARAAALVAFAALAAVRAAAALEAAGWSLAWNDPQTVYERNLRTFPRAFDVMIELAKCHAGREEWAAADELAARAIRTVPDRYHAYAIRAVVARQEGRFEDALRLIAFYRKHVGKQDPWAPAFEADIRAENLNQPERAEALYREAIATRPWSQDALRAAGALAYQLATSGRERQAVALWEEMLVYEPGDRATHHNLARAYTSRGDAAKAARHRALARPVPAP
jgi:tetratricopeptide (TPR) repeat protein